MRIGFIGAGKTGFSLGKYFADGGVTVTGYYSLHEGSARAAAEFTGSRHYCTVDELLKESDAVFLTVPDGEISSVYSELTNYDITGRQICHCSGAMTAAEAFPDIRRRGAYGYSVHPLFPFSSRLESYGKMAGAFFCVEGDREHLGEWQSFLERLGFRTQIIDGEKKARYHAACAISSNLVCALVAESVEILTDCGFASETAMSALAPLIRRNTENILQSGPTAALTGAVERCDTETVKKHLNCLMTDKERELYRAASEKLLDVAKAKNPQTDYSELEKILTGGRS
ncbi:MAG: DUF2520 domain-containing protein [Oscillospiraceae bacterium]